MAKAILELEYMPRFCRECVLSTYKNGINKWVCATSNTIKVVDILGNERADFCPLKLVDEE